MATRRKPPETPPKPRRPATTPDARENQLIQLAVDLAERQMREGTASSQVISHFLKLGSSTEKLSQRKTELENELLGAKKELLEAGARIEELYGNALAAMSDYQGKTTIIDEFDD